MKRRVFPNHRVGDRKGSGPWDVLWRILLIPAYIAITVMSWITPWKTHAPVVVTVLVLTIVLDAFLWRSGWLAAQDRASA